MRISEEFHKVLAIARDYVVALEVKGYVAERLRIAVDIQCLHIISTSIVAVQLFAKEVRKIGRCSLKSAPASLWSFDGLLTI